MTLANVDASGAVVVGESVALVDAYRFVRPRIVAEADLTRLIRSLLRELKRQVIENVSLSVAIDFDDAPLDGLDVTAIAKLPSLVLSGPRVKENRFYSTNTLEEEMVSGANGPEIRRRRPPFTVDLEFAITGASDRAVELLNMMTAVAAFLDRNRWLSMDRDPTGTASGVARWEMDASGELQTNLEGKDDVRAFTWGLVIRGFDIDDRRPSVRDHRRRLRPDRRGATGRDPPPASTRAASSACSASRPTRCSRSESATWCTRSESTPSRRVRGCRGTSTDRAR